MNPLKGSKTRKFIAVMLATVFVITIAATLFAYSYFRNQKITTLEQRVTSFAVALDANEIANLEADESDLQNPAYAKLKEKLTALQNFNSDTEFIYLMGKNPGNQIFFYADSELVSSEDYSPPGQIYDEASEAIHYAFSNGTVIEEVSTDRWGTWLSVMVPVKNSQNETMALVGFDMSYQTFLTDVFLFSALPAAVGIIIIILLIAAFLYAKKDESMMRLKSEYFAIAAHDLRTPLTGIKWAMGTLKQIKAVNTEQKYTNLVDQINQSTENMLSSVNELLDGSSLEKSSGTKLALSKINLSDILHSAYAPLEVTANEKLIETAWKVNKDLTIIGDADKLRRVFANLLSNAIKYSNQNGIINLNGRKNNNAVVISIKDSGIGIPEGEQTKVFNGYFRASNAKEYTTQGTGLGLFYVKNIVLLHKGSVDITSTPGQGTEITLTFPIRLTSQSN